jgi:hypothetical protein
VRPAGARDKPDVEHTWHSVFSSNTVLSFSS